MIRLTSVVLPAPVGTDDGHRLARLGDEREVGDQRPVGGVGERHVLERHPTPRRAVERCGAGVGPLVLGVEQLEHPLGRRHARLQQVHHRRHLRERHLELTGVLQERLHVTDGQRARGDPQPAEHGDDHVVQVADEHHRRLDDARDELGAEAGRVQLVVRLAEAGLDLALAAERLDDGVTRERLLDLGVERAGVPPLGDEPRPSTACAIARIDQHREGDRHDAPRATAPARSRSSSPRRRPA